jgi:hypothetical protein
MLTMPAAVVVSQQAQRVGLIDAAYGVPVGFVLGVLAVGMGRRAKKNLAWLSLDGRGTGVASSALVLGVLAIALALTAALSVGFYEAIQYYQR